MTTSAKKDLMPSSISAAVGAVEQTLKTPADVTENNSDERTETIAQPKLTNPGSIDKSLHSVDSFTSETASRILDSIENYLAVSGKRLADVMFFIYGIVIPHSGGGVQPAIFEDHVVADTKIRCWADVKEFLDEFLRLKGLFFDNVFEERCLGFYHQVTARNEELAHRWNFTYAPNLIRRRS